MISDKLKLGKAGQEVATYMEVKLVTTHHQDGGSVSNVKFISYLECITVQYAISAVSNTIITVPWP
jgi:hypothetical protein